jgi:hypothetical protein
VTERPNHGNRPALLALRKLDVSNEANLGTPATLTIRGQRPADTRQDRTELLWSMDAFSPAVCAVRVAVMALEGGADSAGVLAAVEQGRAGP